MTTTRRSRHQQVVPLAEAADVACAGGKAATLARLQAAGLPVPPGFVIPADVADGPTSDDADHAGLLERLRPDVADALARLGEGPVAVRSSAVAEDLAAASYAGQYETVLGCRDVDEVLVAVERVWASARSSRVAAYRGSQATSAVAVLIQRQVAAETAGVAFTADPVTGERDEVLVSAVAGLGDRLVSGEADADEWRVGHGTARRVVTDPAAPQVLDDRTARAVADLAADVEAHSGFPQDVEWAAAGGRVHLLQARPVTSLPIEPDLPEPSGDGWSKDVAHFVPPMSVLTASIYRPRFERATATAFAEHGALVEGLQTFDRAGELYVRPGPPGGREGPPPPWPVLGLLARVLPPLRARCAAARATVETDRASRLLDQWEEELADRFDAETRRLLAVDLAALDDAALADHLEAAIALFDWGLTLHFRLLLPVMLEPYRLMVACREELGWDDGEVLALLGGSSRASSAPTAAVDELAERARNLPGVAEWAAAGADLDELAGVDADLADEVRALVDRFGHRTLDNDLTTPTLAERPELLLRQLRDRLVRPAGATGAPDDGRQPASPPPDPEARFAEAIAGRDPETRERLQHQLARAQRAYGAREHNVVVVLLAPIAAIRYAVVEAGHRLVVAGALARGDDVFSCEEDEVLAALRGHAPDGLAVAAARRRGERAWVAAHPGPATLGSSHPPADVRALPAPAREVNAAMLWFLERQLPTEAAAGADTESLTTGLPASPGRYQGTVRVVRDPADFDRLGPGEVLVCPVTSTSWSVVFGTAGALITDHGGPLSHPAIIAREHGIPAVVGTTDATTVLRDGLDVVVDGTTGRVEPVPA